MKIGVIGAGVIGGLRARSIRETAGCELTAVFDPNEPAAARAAAGAKVFTDLDRFMDAEMDAVVVSSPPHVHEPACLAAYARGRHVLCEKPLSNTLEGARRIVEAAIAADRVLAVGFNLRYYPFVRLVREAIESGAIGELDHLRIFGGHEGVPKFRIDWQYKAPESGGGALWDVGIHMTDVARHLMGEITEVSGVSTEKVWKIPGSEDNAIAVFRSPNGIAASYQATWIEWTGYKCMVEAYGSHGMVRGFYAPMQNVLITSDKPGGPTKVVKNNHLDVKIREKLYSWHDTALRSFKGELNDFLSMAAGGPSGVLADGYAGLRSIEIAEAVKESSAKSKLVKLPVLGRMRP